MIWDAHLNRLFVDNKKDKYHAICYYQEQKMCRQCPGFNLGLECSHAGDCTYDAKCQCDTGFVGPQCEIPRKLLKKSLD